jgi:lysophospholipase L1-like esterase
MWKYAREVKRISSRPGVVLEHRPNAEATLMGVRVRTDARGFRRASPEIEARRGSSERLVVVVGDSCALGWGVPEGETLSDHLEERLNASRSHSERSVLVLNAGVGNSNTSMEFARYLQDVRSLDPDWVILAYFINDAEPDPPARRPFLQEHSALFATLSTRLPLLLSPLHRDYHTYFTSLYGPGNPGWEPFRAAVRNFGKALREDGVPGTLLLMPEMHEPRDFASFADVYGDVAELATESGFTEVVDPSADFAPGSGEPYWVTPGDFHPNGAAQDLMAAALARSGVAQRLLASLDAAPGAGDGARAGAADRAGTAAEETPPAQAE